MSGREAPPTPDVADPAGTPGNPSAASAPSAPGAQNAPHAPADPAAAPRFGSGDAQWEIPPVSLEENRTLYTRAGKRLLDLFGSGLALLLLSPVFAALAVGIKLDTRGPVFYRSWRVGEGGEPFHFYKFRSMIEGADRVRDTLLDRNEVDGPVFKIADDPRITRMGRFLRRTSLDELPQLWNVLRGEMSLVGPRPPIPAEVVQYEPWQRRRLAVRPGITCLWQISGRSEIGFDEWMRLDMEYIENRGFLLDLKILLRTVPAVMSGRGAY